MEAATPAEDATYFKNREAKQDYLKTEIIDKGYDTVDFAQFLLDQKGRFPPILTPGEKSSEFSRFIRLLTFYIENGIEIDNWTLEELTRITQQFQK
jgi:hypothetical protein